MKINILTVVIGLVIWFLLALRHWFKKHQKEQERISLRYREALLLRLIARERHGKAILDKMPSIDEIVEDTKVISFNNYVNPYI